MGTYPLGDVLFRLTMMYFVNKRHKTFETWLKFCQKKNPVEEGDYIKAVYLYYDDWPGYGEEFTLQEYEGVVFVFDEE